MDSEVKSIRQEVDEIAHKIGLLKEAHELKQEVLAIQDALRSLLQVKAQEDTNKQEEEEKASENTAKLREEEALKDKEFIEQKEQEERVRKALEERDRKEREQKEAKEKEQREKEQKEREQREREQREKEAKEKEQREREQREKDAKEKEQREKEQKEREQRERQQREAKEKEAKEQQSKKDDKSNWAPEFVVQKSGSPEDQIRSWIEAVSGEKLASEPLQPQLKSGTVLCTLINKIKPNTVKKVNKMNAPFMQMENIQNFLLGCTSLGVPKEDLFQTVDLYENKNMNQVLLTIESLGRISRRVEGYSGPSLGPKLADKHNVTFTEDQLRKGQNVLSFAQATQLDSQKEASSASKTGYRDVVKTSETGTNEMKLFDKDKVSVQKDASSARKQAHNIIR